MTKARAMHLTWIDALRHRDTHMNIPVEEPRSIVAVNNHSGYSRWAFGDISGQWKGEHTIRAILAVQPEPLETP